MEESGGRKEKKEMKQLYYDLNNKKSILKVHANLFRIYVEFPTRSRKRKSLDSLSVTSSSEISSVQCVSFGN